MMQAMPFDLRLLIEALQGFAAKEGATDVAVVVDGESRRIEMVGFPIKGTVHLILEKRGGVG